MKKGTRTVVRSSVTGKFVPRKQAVTNPARTVTETIKPCKK